MAKTRAGFSCNDPISGPRPPRPGNLTPVGVGHEAYQARAYPDRPSILEWTHPDSPCILGTMLCVSAGNCCSLATEAEELSNCAGTHEGAKPHVGASQRACAIKKMTLKSPSLQLLLYRAAIWPTAYPDCRGTPIGVGVLLPPLCHYRFAVLPRTARGKIS